MWRNVIVLLPVFMCLAAVPGHAAVDLDDINLPPGFSIEVYAEVPNARSMALGPNGIVFVSNRRADSVYAVVPGPGGRNRVVEITDDLSTPNGIAYKDGDLYVAEISRVLVYRNIDSRINNPPEPEVLDIELPSKSHHGWRYIAFGPDGKLYISIGAPCNICDEQGFAKIIRTNVDGSARETVAAGVRNSVGFTWHPTTGEFWFTDNGRDMLGDDTPPGELNRVTEIGQHFGFPYCHGGEVLDSEYGDGKDCNDYEPPAQKLGPHVAGLGVKFYTGEMFPNEYSGQVFIAEHGSWNRSKKIGYRVSLVRFADGQPVSYETFADGWLQRQETKGRPVDLLVLEDGSLLVSDDFDGKLYRISYEEFQ
ncbi:MAG: PQQ-dependent sugar dehydrogenase [Gammaproteobacteria bacterium]|nr:PQQ-dependent sugar dehydrogenase [Gammaproteobacteria bacterium]